MKIRKMAGNLIIFALTAALLTGCAGKAEPKNTVQSSSSSQTTAQPRKPVTMQVSIWGNDAHKKMYEDLLAKYKEKNPNVTSEVLIIPMSEYQQKISILKAGGQAPDISWLSDTMISQFLGTNQLMDLSKLVSDKEYDFNDINPATLEPVKKDGKFYGVAFSTPPSIIYFNKNLFKGKNLQTPLELYKAGKWDFDGMLKAARELSNKEKGTYGIKMVNDWKSWYYAVIDFVWGFGGDVFSNDGTKFILNSPEGEKGVQMYYDMIFKDEVHPKPGDQTTFESGKIGMNVNTLAYMSTAKNIKDFEWDIAPMPAGPKSTFTRTGFATYTMFKVDNDPKADEKFELFKYLTGKEAMKVTSQYFVPSRKSIVASDEFKKIYPQNVQESFQATIVDRLSTAKVPVTPINFSKINSEVMIFFDLLYTKNITVKDALKQMEEKVNPLMK